jgi:hypothetical protein
MDPYLEEEHLWPEFHHLFITCFYQVLLRGLVDRYRAQISQRHYRTEPPRSTSELRGEQHEELIEVRQRSDGRLVTLVDVVSPANKMIEKGRQAYLEKRREGKTAGANLVEIDLVLQGQPMLDYSREGLPDWDYAVTVTRATQPDRFEIYTATLQKRLPRFRLPLSNDDRDTVVDLQTTFTRSFDQGGFAAKIDYQRDPATTLSNENRQWLHEYLRHMKLRPPTPPNKGSAPVREDVFSHEHIAVAAYYLWQKEGCPHGHDQEHWYQALEQLRRETEAGAGL